ncbi:hypothetical protein PR002_g31178, partial [Phytophthora rubi]
QGGVIPWKSIDERWMNVDASVRHVKQFGYNIYDINEARRVKKKLRTHAERYREADTWRAIKTGRPQDNSHELPSDINQSSALSLNCAGASDESVAEVSGTSGASVSHTLRLSVKARCPGRKKKNVKQATVDERASRRWYEASEEAKDKAGYRSLRDLVDALDQHKPSLTETTERLSGVIVKGGAYDRKKVSYKKLRNLVLIRDSFYLLPPILLKACMDAFPVSNSECDAIAVYDEADSSSTRSINAADNDLVEVVYIKDF